MNPLLKGSQRDNRIILDLEEYKALSIQQIQELYFPFPYGMRKAQERMLKLNRKGKVRRFREPDGYCYTLGDKPKQLGHLLMLNWVRIWITKGLSSWEKLHSWQYEDDYKTVRPDAFVAIKNVIRGDFRLLFIEMDRSRNDFDKVKKYNKLFEEINSDKHQGRWWLKVTKKFPTVLIVTISPARKEEIIRRIRDENKNNLRFEVKLLEDIK